MRRWRCLVAKVALRTLYGAVVSSNFPSLTELEQGIIKGFCKRESSAKFEAASFAQPYTAESNGQWAPLVTVDCRGLEFVK